MLYTEQHKNSTKIWAYIAVFFVFLISPFFAKAEVINDFQSTISVSPDASVTIKEKIIYDFEGAFRHGIFRTIPLLNSQNKPIQINVLSVTDKNNQPYQFTDSISDDILNIKIGDPNNTISGIKEYDITYKIIGSIGYYQDYDEIYWNVTGNDWPVAIKKSEATVLLPNGILPSQQSCYVGVKGDDSKCKITAQNIFTAPAILNAGQGLTIAVGFPKGVVAVYQAPIDSDLVKFIKTFWPILIPVFVFIIMFYTWNKKGRDPKGTGVIVAQYDVPDELTPLEVSGIVNEQIENKNISAEIIYLATKGFLHINQITEKTLIIFSSKDYEFTLLKDPKELSNSFDRKLIFSLFGVDFKVGDKVTLSSLKNEFYLTIPIIGQGVVSSLLSKKYYTNLSTYLSPILFARKNLFVGIGIIITASVIVLGFKGDNIDLMNESILILSILVSIIIWIIFQGIMPAKSQKGVATREYLLGLKEYLQIVEKDRLNFHNAPDKKPEIFESLLPYAMIFGVEKAWAKEFEGIYTMPPSWYSGYTGPFSATTFSHNMTHFSGFATDSLSSTPGGSGSFGGGSSGGGGGGGGGGSW